MYDTRRIYRVTGRGRCGTPRRCVVTVVTLVISVLVIRWWWVLVIWIVRWKIRIHCLYILQIQITVFFPEIEHNNYMGIYKMNHRIT